MPGKRPQSELLAAAIYDLNKLGYVHNYLMKDKADGGKSVEWFCRSDSSDLVVMLVQTRSCQDNPQPHRYWVGFMAQDLPKVNQAVVWLEGEPVLFIFPSEDLMRILEGYCSPNEIQWKVDIDVLKMTLSPQNSGEHIDISKFSIKIPPSQPT